MRKIRILFDHQAFEIQSYGGVSRYFSELLRHLQDDQEFECTVAIAHSCNFHINRGAYLKRDSLLANLNFKGKHKVVTVLNKTKSILALRRGAYDIFHPTYYDPYFLKHIGSMPFVLTIHDMIHETFPDQVSLTDKTPLWKRALAEKATMIIAISQSTKTDVQRFYNIQNATIDVIHHGGSLFENGHRAVGGEYVPEKFILFVGRRGLYKNFALFIKAVTPLLRDDSALKVVCAGGGPFDPDHTEVLENLDLRGRIYQYDVDDDALGHLYRNALALVFPSLYEGFGLPVLEAFQCGCPVICSDVSSLPEVAGDAAAYCDPNDSSAMEKTIKAVIYNEPLRQELKMKGFHQIRQLSWQKTAELTKALYKRVYFGRAEQGRRLQVV